MSKQMTDPFILEDDEWVFLGADDVYSLFDPERYGLKPEAPHTACWKGFVVQFRTVRKRLYLDRLLVHCGDDVYPPINGVIAFPGAMGMRVYDNIRLPLFFTGVILIGKDCIFGERYRLFSGPESYERTLELTFENGTLTGVKDTSGPAPDDETL